MLDKTLRCLCGRLYVFYSMMVGDQSVCPKCRQAVQDEIKKQNEQDR